MTGLTYAKGELERNPRGVDPAAHLSMSMKKLSIRLVLERALSKDLQENIALFEIDHDMRTNRDIVVVKRKRDGMARVFVISPSVRFSIADQMDPVEQAKLVLFLA